jgi:hypothetical protein
LVEAASRRASPLAQYREQADQPALLVVQRHRGHVERDAAAVAPPPGKGDPRGVGAAVAWVAAQKSPSRRIE